MTMMTLYVRHWLPARETGCLGSGLSKARSRETRSELYRVLHYMCSSALALPNALGSVIAVGFPLALVPHP